jgi:hypothetical protein
METTVFTFGRMNPPTIGHEKLVNKVKETAKRNAAEPHVFLSHSQNAKKDPLSYDQKFKYAKQAFGNIVQRSNSRNIIQIMQELEKMKYKDVIMVVGSDRVQEFRTLLNKYNGKEYNFDSISVISAGERDPDAEGVSGMSASKMRAVATEGDKDAFFGGAPKKLSLRQREQMYNEIRKAMNIKEDFDIDEFVETVDIDTIELEDDIIEEAVLTIQQRIKRARQMKRLAPRFKQLRKIKAKRMADPKRLMQRARKQALSVVRKRVAGERGEKYQKLSPSAKMAVDNQIQKKLPAIQKLAQRLLPKVRQKEMERLKKARSSKNESLDIVEVRQDPDIKDRKGTQPAKYFKDLSKSTKAARDAHFKKKSRMSDEDPKAYEPAPGDKSADTKPSKHTKKYNQMFGESNGQTDDVQDIVPNMMRVSMISSSKKKVLNDKFEKLSEQDSAERTKDRHAAERERLKQQHKREKEQLKTRHSQQMDRSQIRDIRAESLDEAFEQALKPRQQKGSSSIAPRDNYTLEEKQIDALKKKAEKSGMPYSILKQVYNRGMSAYRTGHRPGTTPHQWAFARVNSFVTKSKGTWGGADKDLAAKVGGKKESVRVGPYMDKAGITESLDESFQMMIQQPAGYGQMVTAKEAGIDIQAGFALHPSVAEEGGAGEFGTDKLVKKYKEDTPGEGLKEEAWIQFESCCEDCMEQLQITEAEYEGKKVKLNDPIRTSENPNKKFKVYVKDPSTGNIKVVRFGDPNLSIKRDDPGRRRNFRARHDCDNPGPITKARYWSCRMWSKKSVSELD